MKIGLVGYQGSGKSTLFTWLTNVDADPSMSHVTQSAMATVRDPRVDQLCKIYNPKKVTHASIELVDTPGLSRSQDGNAARLGALREVDCLVHVISVFLGSNLKKELQSFQEDLLLADLEIVTGRVERLRESVKKPRPNRDEEQAELSAIEPIMATLEEGQPLTTIDLSDDQKKAIRSYRLLTEKRCMTMANVADDETDLDKFQKYARDDRSVLAVPIGLELELERMSDQDREEFREEMEIGNFDRDGLLRTLMDVSGQMLFFTAGEKEVRTWMIQQGATAVEAADTIHSDLARGFIRAEIMSCSDLIRLGSEREIKAAGLVRQEPKDYVVQEGDVLNIRFSV